MQKIIVRIIEILPKYKRIDFLFLCFFMLIQSILELLGVGILPFFIKILSNPEIVLHNPVINIFTNSAIFINKSNIVLIFSILIFCFFLLKMVYSIFFEYKKSKFVFECFSFASESLFKTYMRAKYVYHLDKNSSTLIRNITRDSNEFANNIVMSVLNIFTQTLTLIAIFVLLIILEPLISIITIISLSFVAILYYQGVRKQLKYYGNFASIQYSEIIKTVSEGLGGFKEISILNRREYFTEKLISQTNNLKKSQIFVSVANLSAKPFFEFIAIGGVMLVVMIMLIQNRNVVSILPILTLFGAASIKLLPALSQIINQLTQLRYYNYSLESIYSDVIKNDNSVNDIKFSSSEKIAINHSIELKDITYNYPKTTDSALNNINLIIKKGSFVAFVGTSGSGKTTLIDLIMGLLIPDSGEILIDNVKFQENAQSWSESIGYVPQQIYLTDDTIRNNIALGINSENICNEKIKNAIFSAKLDDYIDSLENGLDTVVGERGVRMSGGQRQRIGIARALYNDPDLLIMDEATSALDNVTESHIIDAISSLKGDRTIIMIAHRLTTIINCDTLYLMNEGKIIDQGSYEHLLNTNLVFQRMLKMK